MHSFLVMQSCVDFVVELTLYFVFISLVLKSAIKQHRQAFNHCKKEQLTLSTLGNFNRLFKKKIFWKELKQFVGVKVLKHDIVFTKHRQRNS